MELQTHGGLFFSLLLAGMMVVELYRFAKSRQESGISPYPARRLRLRFFAFLLLEGSLFVYLLPGWLGGVSLTWQLASLGTALILALLAIIPTMRDWRDVHQQISADSDEVTRMVSEALRHSLEQELGKQPPASAEEENRQ